MTRFASSIWRKFLDTSGSDLKSDSIQPSSRHALLHVPAAYDGKTHAPLIVGLHGKSQPPAEFAEHTQFSESGFEGLVVFPEGIKLQWTGDPEAPPRSEVNDIEFINVLIDQIQNDYLIDTSRIYVAGFSNGGGLSGLLACDPTASGRVAAFAISSGAFYRDEALREPGLFSQCHASRLPVPILEFHGDSDPVEHYDGKTTPDGPSYSIPDWLGGWIKRNTAGEEWSGQKKIYDGKVVRYAASDDKGKELVVHYYIHGFGHGWPTTRPLNNDEQRHGPTVFNATPIVLDWFNRFHLEKNGSS